MSANLTIEGKTITANKVEVLISGPKAKESNSFAAGHVAISFANWVFEVGRYAGTYRTQFRDASPEAVRDAAGQAGWAVGPGILIARNRKRYLSEETRSRNVRGYTMRASSGEIQSMMKYIKARIDSAKLINTEVKSSTEKDMRYLASVLRSDPTAFAYKLPTDYKLVGNSCLDFVAEALDNAYWIWDFDNLTSLTPSDLSRQLENNDKYTTNKKTYSYKGNSKDSPGWWFNIGSETNPKLKDGPSRDFTITDVLDYAF